MAAGAYGRHDPFLKNSTAQTGAVAAAEVVGCGDDAV
jgi:hypothetical protein